MRASLLFLSAIAAAAAVACSDRATPTDQRAGPSFGLQANAGGNGPYRNVSNGARADVSWSGDSLSGTYTNGSLAAARSDSLGQENTTVNWNIQQCDIYWSCQYSYGYGTIPSSVFTINGDRQAHLVFDPRDYPGQLWISGDTLGPVDVSWTKTGSYSFSSSGTSETVSPGYRFRTRGSYETSGAAVTGHAGIWVFGPGTSGSIGTNRNMEFTFYR